MSCPDCYPKGGVYCCLHNGLPCRSPWCATHGDPKAPGNLHERVDFWTWEAEL